MVLQTARLDDDELIEIVSMGTLLPWEDRSRAMLIYRLRQDMQYAHDLRIFSPSHPSR